MEKMVSSWCGNVKSVPQDYVFPKDMRPGDEVVPFGKNFPVIDLEKAVFGDRNEVIEQVIQACQESGFFQVINHGISKDLINDTMEIVKEFFNMPNEDKESLFSFDPNKSCRLYTSSLNYAKESIHIWRDALTHLCHPLDEYIHLWPEKPSKFRNIVGKYSVKVRNLSMKILEMIGEGLRLKPGYFGDELAGTQLLTMNCYPPCPEPNLTLAILKHCDPNLITILYQEITSSGLQVLKDGKWYVVEPLANAFVVNIGQILKVLTNGKFTSSEHRAVTNSKEPRYTIASFINPRSDSIIKTMKVFADEDDCRSLYRAFKYKEFDQAFQEHKGDNESTLAEFKNDAYDM